MSKKLKILHYIPVYAPAWKFGGPVLSVSQLCEGLANLGHEIEVFTSNAGLENQSNLILNKPIIRNGVKVTYFEQKPGRSIHCPGMEEEVKKRAQEFDIIHITAIWQPSSRAACKIAKSKNIPYMISPRGSLGSYAWRHKTFKKLVFYLLQENFNVRNATAIHYTSKQELEECKWLKLPGKNFIVPNGLNIKFWETTRTESKKWRYSQGLSEDVFLILNVGRLHHKKGLDLLPKVLEPLQNFNWQMVFVGGDDDGTKEKLKQEFQKLNLLDRISFIDRCEPKELSTIYSAANLFVLPSRHENFGNVVLEALVCGCPVLISDKVALHNEVSEAAMGWVCPRIAVEWTNLIKELIQSPVKLQKVATTSRLHVESIFSIEKTALEMANHYFEIIGK